MFRLTNRSMNINAAQPEEKRCGKKNCIDTHKECRLMHVNCRSPSETCNFQLWLHRTCNAVVTYCTKVHAQRICVLNNCDTWFGFSRWGGLRHTHLNAISDLNKVKPSTARDCNMHNLFICNACKMQIASYKSEDPFFFLKISSLFYTKCLMLFLRGLQINKIAGRWYIQNGRWIRLYG